MTRLNQIIAVETALAADAERAIAHAKRELAAEDRLAGISKTYRPREEDGEMLPPKSTKVQVKAEDVLSETAAVLARLFDVRLTKDAANASAAVDLIVRGEVLLHQAPVTYMLFLERELNELSTLVAAVPLLDPAESWTQDPVSGHWRSMTVETERTKKVPKTHIAHPGNEHHAPQVIPYNDDIVAGYWATTKFSGGVPADRVKAVQDRIRELRDAVKYAREEGNSAEIRDRHAGHAVLTYVFSGRLPASAA